MLILRIYSMPCITNNNHDLIDYLTPLDTSKLYYFIAVSYLYFTYFFEQKLSTK